MTSSNSTEVAPGAQVTFSLGQLPGLELDAATHLYRYTLTAGDGTTSTVWINTGAALAQKLALAARFNLGGVLARGLIGILARAWRVLRPDAISATSRDERDRANSRSCGRCAAQDGTQLPGGTSALTDTTYVWTAPADPGRYTIAAALPGSATRGEVELNVAQATPTPTPAPTAAPVAAQPTATLVSGTTEKCPDGKFVADVTVPDGTQFDKGKEFTKTWKVQNSGACDWPAGTVAAYAAGEKMGAPDSVKIGAVKSGETRSTSACKMKAPDKDDNFKATWRLMDDKGNLFGEPFTVVIVSGQPQAVAAARRPQASQPAALRRRPSRPGPPAALSWAGRSTALVSPTRCTMPA